MSFNIVNRQLELLNQRVEGKSFVFEKKKKKKKHLTLLQKQKLENKKKNKLNRNKHLLQVIDSRLSTNIYAQKAQTVKKKILFISNYLYYLKTGFREKTYSK